MSGEMSVSPVGATIAGKIALPSARAWVNSAKHHFEASQFGVWMMMTAWDFSTSVERPLPIRAGRNAGRLVLIEESRLEPHAREPGLHLRRLIVVRA